MFLDENKIIGNGQVLCISRRVKRGFISHRGYLGIFEAQSKAMGQSSDKGCT